MIFLPGTWAIKLSVVNKAQHYYKLIFVLNGPPNNCSNMVWVCHRHLFRYPSVGFNAITFVLVIRPFWHTWHKLKVTIDLRDCSLTCSPIKKRGHSVVKNGVFWVFLCRAFIVYLMVFFCKFLRTISTYKCITCFILIQYYVFLQDIHIYTFLMGH